MPIPIRCSGCSRTINAPDHAAGKRVKCPACATVLTVAAAGNAATPTRQQVATQQAPAPATRQASAANASATQRPASPAPAFSPFAPEKTYEDDGLLTDSDFTTRNPIAPKGPTDPNIPQPKKKVKRSASVYKLPGVAGIIAAIMNILLLVGILVLLIIVLVALASEAGAGAMVFIIPIAIFLVFAGFAGASNAHAIVACLNLIHMTNRGAAQLAVGSFFFLPLTFAFDMWIMTNLLIAIIVGVVMAIYNWPVAIWVAIIISGEQAKIDFDEIDDDELEELAAELQRRAAKKEGGH